MSTIWHTILHTVSSLWQSSGLVGMSWRELVMLLLGFFLLYLAIAKKFEPLLLVPIAFGMLLTNLPGAGLYHPELWTADPVTHTYSYQRILNEGGLLDLLYIGVKAGIFPPLIFLGIGAMTDFGPLIANPKSFLLGAAAQGGIFFTYIGAALLGFSPAESGSVAIIGGADGPTSIFVSSQLLTGTSNRISTGTIALAAYTYMALVPILQPPIMKLLTTKAERAIPMQQLRTVSKREKICFPILVTLVVSLLVPDAAVLVACGILLGKLLCRLSGGTINPLIGSAGVSAVPMAARISQKVGAEANPNNFLLMHAMGPNVAGVIGSAIAAGVILQTCAH